MRHVLVLLGFCCTATPRTVTVKASRGQILGGAGAGGYGKNCPGWSADDAVYVQYGVAGQAQ